MSGRIGTSFFGLCPSDGSPYEYKTGQYCSNEDDSAQCGECMAAWYKFYRIATRKTWTSDPIQFQEMQFREFVETKPCKRCIPVIEDDEPMMFSTISR